MHPVQFPLHEPYFDLTPIKVTHTKITKLKIYNYLSKKKNKNITKLTAHTPFSAWRVVSTHLMLNSPWRGDSRLLVIPYSCSRISDYNPQIVTSNFRGLAPFYNIASLCRGICGTSIAHVIKAMMTCLSPRYITFYKGRFFKYK